MNRKVCFFLLCLSFNSFAKDAKSSNSSINQMTYNSTQSLKKIVTYPMRWKMQDILIKNGQKALGMYKRVKEDFSPLNENSYYKLLLIVALELNYDKAFAKKLINMIDSVDYYLKNGESPIFFASYFNHIDLVKKLLDNGADSFPRSNVSSYNPVLFSIRMANWKMFRLLADYGNVKNSDLVSLNASMWLYPTEREKIPKDISVKFSTLVKGEVNHEEYLDLQNSTMKKWSFMRAFQDFIMSSCFWSPYSKLKPTHMLGYINFGSVEGTFFPEEIKGRNIYVFTKPKWGAKISKVINVTTVPSLYQNFALSVEFGNQMMGIPVSRVDNYWVKVAEGWIHSSQFYFFTPVEVFLKNAMLSSKSNSFVFEKVNGKPIEYKKKGNEVVGDSLSVIETKWVNEVLWLKVENFGQDSFGGQLRHTNPVWFKPFNKDGSQNFVNHSRGF